MSINNLSSLTSTSGPSGQESMPKDLSASRIANTITQTIDPSLYVEKFQRIKQLEGELK
jgi:hypothetical protein